MCGKRGKRVENYSLLLLKPEEPDPLSIVAYDLRSTQNSGVCGVLALPPNFLSLLSTFLCVHSNILGPWIYFKSFELFQREGQIFNGYILVAVYSNFLNTTGSRAAIKKSWHSEAEKVLKCVSSCFKFLVDATRNLGPLLEKMKKVLDSFVLVNQNINLKINKILNDLLIMISCFKDPLKTQMNFILVQTPKQF